MIKIDTIRQYSDPIYDEDIIYWNVYLDGNFGEGDSIRYEDKTWIVNKVWYDININEHEKIYNMVHCITY